MVMIVLSLLFLSTLLRAETDPLCTEIYGGMYNPDKLFTIVNRSAELAELDPMLIVAVIHIESSWNICAVSSKGAIGLMQITLPTAKIFDPYITQLELFDPYVNINIGSLYLGALVKYYGNIYNALLAYNAGPRRAHYPQEAHRYALKVIGVYKKLRRRYE
ncbi:transglycosylase SLT domain-containing protein [Hydrogenivirga sp. 128-5-R1-1]|uniref:lytic transglycosylase domain-containing protein n=1 Tax=Hydrogenivirga sp. 128-5-R1-1 TaxID=392423 RepID=UPI00015F3378|nr:transglycosylase SLT domain-containing protein [Hydrogenivirga sp. 128-5-R1-1]EDP74860.1 hypothetical protein HG1285_13367 [Hydrogenivirga sp. 128-5-R1-1]